MTPCVLCVFIESSGGSLPFFPDINAGFWSCCSIYHAQIANGVPNWDLMTSQEASTIELFWVKQVEHDEKYSSFSYKIFRKIEKCYWHRNQHWSSRLTWTLPDPSTDVHRLARLFPSILHSTALSDELPDFALVHLFPRSWIQMISHRGAALSVCSCSRIAIEVSATANGVRRFV